MTPKEMQDRWGVHWQSIDFILGQQVPRLDRERARLIMLAANLNVGQHLSERRALDATRLVPGMERQAVAASEDLRKAIWDVIWDSSWADAWILSWIIAQCGIGVSTVDMVGNAGYSVEDYTVLVGPWLMGGFPDMPFPREE